MAARRGPRPVGQGLPGELLDAGQLRGVVDRAQLGGGVQAGADGDGLRPLGEGFDDVGVQPGGDVEALDRHADLSAVAERRPEQPVGDPLHVDVVEQDGRVVAAQLQRHAGERVRRSPATARPVGTDPVKVT